MASPTSTLVIVSCTTGGPDPASRSRQPPVRMATTIQVTVDPANSRVTKADREGVGTNLGPFAGGAVLVRWLRIAHGANNEESGPEVFVMPVIRLEWSEGLFCKPKQLMYEYPYAVRSWDGNDT